MRAPAAPIDLALRAVELVQADPARAALLAEEARQAAEPGSEAELVAEWAAGLSLRERDRLGAARERLRHAAELARRARMRQREGQISSSLALVELYRGESRAALRAAGRAAGLLEGADAARNAMQRGLILQRLGRDGAALAAYEEAMPGLQRAGDRLAELRLRLNRSVLHAYRGELPAATRDLETAIGLARALEQGLLIARCAHNLGFVAGRRGDVPAALRWFDEAEQRYREAEPGGAWRPVLEVDRAELLLSAGLAAEASTRARVAVDALVASGNAAEEAEARLLAARAALAAGEHEAAVEEASGSAEAFRRQRRASWALLADAVALGAQAEASDADLHGRARDATVLARRLERAGRRTDARSAHILAGRLALAAGDRATARGALAAVGRARPGEPALLRIQAWHATALLRALEGERTGARRAVAAGLRVLDRHRQTFGAEELRAGVAVHGVGLARVAVRLALESDDAWAALAAVESVRAASLELPAARPPRDDELAARLAELRALDADLRAAPTGPSSHDRLLRRRAALEAEVRGRVLARSGGDAREAPARLRRDRLLRALGPATLLAYFVEGGSLHAVAVAGGRAHLHRLGAADEAAAETAALLFALRRLVRRGRSDAATAAALAGLEASAARLTELVLPPLDDDGARLVIVPTGALHRLPWGALAAVAARPADRRAVGRVLAARAARRTSWTTARSPSSRGPTCRRRPPRSRRSRARTRARWPSGRRTRRWRRRSGPSTAPRSPTWPRTASCAPTTRCSRRCGSPTGR